jgi:nicotinate-nucleotide adenylyltransferase
MPTFLAPHKEMPTFLTPTQRLELLHLAFAECLPDERIIIDDYELQKGGYSYTYETLQHFCAPERELWFLCGTDMFLTLDAWRNPQIIFGCANIAFLLRAQQDRAQQAQIDAKAQYYRDTYGARIVQIPCDIVDISSSELRQCADSAYLPRSVKAYLDKLEEGKA